MTTSEQISSMALAMMFSSRGKQLRQLYQRAGSAATIVEHADRLHEIAPDINLNVFSIDTALLAQYIAKAQTEAQFAADHGISILTLDSPRYPARLREVCPDAPLALYYRGNAELNATHILSIVGTRRSTDYGRHMVQSICAELARWYPDLLIVSGLAYGTDINAHRAALDNQLSTVGVLAHGLDTLYPSSHRNTATRMLNSGGLLTEYPTATRPDGHNFLHRNRLIAGIAEATLIVESRERGGSLTTARIANEYGLSVMACPGRATDEASIGCNRLIHNNGAALVTSAADIVRTLCWQVPQHNAPATPSLFDNNLSSEEQIVYRQLTNEPRHFADIVNATQLPVPTILATLSELEFRQLALQLPGSKWRLP
ncbi:MAG: DNA-processing protein DprA [Bacteroidaceae bacterium]|nr:DNA-processing protein DprA [Bacteroidaceae bacterium]